SPDILRILLLRSGGEASEVTEEDRDDLPLFRCRGVSFHGYAAERTERELSVQLAPAAAAGLDRAVHRSIVDPFSAIKIAAVHPEGSITTARYGSCNSKLKKRPRFAGVL